MKEVLDMAAYAVDTNKVFAISRERLAKSKCQPSPEWKKMAEWCDTHDIYFERDKNTGELLVRSVEIK